MMINKAGNILFMQDGMDDANILISRLHALQRAQ